MDPLKAKANFTRICQLLIDKGGDALRAALHVIHPPATLAAALNAHVLTLQKIKNIVIKPPQWQLLFPPSGNPDSKKFDITLLTILLRNICGLPSPVAGWNVMPPASDTSISANILRIKMYRNEVYGHIPSAQYDDATFERLWQEISKPLIKLLVLRRDIDELKVAPLTPEEESYNEKLKEWKELEDNLLEKLDDVEIKIDDMASEVMKLRDTMGTLNLSKVDQLAKFNFTGKIDGLCKKFQDGTRQWFFDQLSRWFMDEESRVMILTGGPGVGKSVLSAKVGELFEGQLAAYHFCDFRTSDYRKPSSILQSLASQMCDNVDGFREKLTEILGREHSRNSLSDVFRVLLNDPLHALDRREPMLIVVDALDESKTDDKSEFLELISDEFPELPKWIKILISSRPELQVKKKLEHFNPFEIHPDDYDHKQDLKHFFRCHLPDLNEDNLISLVRKCNGSFLYAYYVVKELKEMHFVDETNISDYAPKGISGFYEKQFMRLKTDLQRFNPSIFNGFVNVVAAIRAPLPIKIIFNCMDLSGEQYEIRNAIINIMSEILPVYDSCLTVYHKSLTDWLTLNGYEEHAFKADVGDGAKRLWQACKGIYENIDFQKSVSDFELSPEREYALENGGEYLAYVGDTEDFHWLVNIRLNALKFMFCGGLNINFFHILRIYQSKLTKQLCRSIFQQLSISKIISRLSVPFGFDEKRMFCYIYLQSLANGHFDFLKNSISCKNIARHILDEVGAIWMEEETNVNNSDNTIISNAVFPYQFGNIISSPDNKLLVCLHMFRKIVTVFELPSLTMIFELELSQVNINHNLATSTITFSPDSSYFLCDSIRYCVCIRKQKEVTFITRGPASIVSCSFSSCGSKLVTSEDNFVKVWDVKKKDLLVQVETWFSVDHCFFSSCNAYIFGLTRFGSEKCVTWDSATLKELGIRNFCFDFCLTNKENLEIILLPYRSPSGLGYIKYGHFHLPSGQVVLRVPNRYCARSFTWKNRKCVVFSHPPSALVVYDFINQEVIDRFQIDCLPRDTSIDCISKLDATNFLVYCNSNLVIILSFRTPEESSIAAFVNSVVKCCTVSPDNMYIACCYENCILTINSVDNGETLQTVVLQQAPETCWWSESYLWVVCKGEVVKFSYDSTSTTVLGNDLEECNINFLVVLGFAEGVLVVCLNDKGEISIFKICNEKLCSQRIPDSISAVSSVAISSDGCAVLLYRQSSLEYQLWEVACENRWELHSAGRLHNPDTTEVEWLCLTGTQNCRNSMWLTCNRDDTPSSNLSLSFIDLSTGTLFEHHLTTKGRDVRGDSYVLRNNVRRVYYVSRNFLIIHAFAWMHVINISDGNTSMIFYVGDVGMLEHASYLLSTGRLLLVFKNDIKCFKIHNLENHIES